MAPDASANIGHNSMTELDIIRDSLTNEFTGLENRRDELIAATNRIPDEIEDAETEGRLTDHIGQINAAIKKSDASRKDRKEPFLAGGRLVDSYFAQITEPLKSAKAKALGVLTSYQRKQAAEERRRREDAERKAREEAEAARKAAEEAEAVLKNDDGLDAAIEAEERAKQAAADAAKTAKDAAAKAAAMHTSRGDYGASGSLRTFWTFKNLNRANLDLEALRHHIPEDALEKAVRAFIKTGAHELKGVEIYEDTQTVVR